MFGFGLCPAERDDMRAAHAGAPVGAERNRRQQPSLEVLQGRERRDELVTGEIAPAALQPLDHDPRRGQRGDLYREMPGRDIVSSLEGIEPLQGAGRLVAVE